MKPKFALLATLLATAIMANAANAYTISTYVGDIVVTPGVAPYDPSNVGTLQNANQMNGVGYGTSYWLGYPSVQVAGSTLDHYWVQSATNEIIWKLNRPTNSVIGFPGNDHGPLPMENMEYIIKGSNDGASWFNGSLVAIYHDGLDSTHPELEDYFATQWDFASNYLYFKTVGTPGVVRGWNDFDPEMDGIAGRLGTPLPLLPITMGLTSLISGGLFFRRKKQTV